MEIEHVEEFVMLTSLCGRETDQDNTMIPWQLTTPRRVRVFIPLFVHLFDPLPSPDNNTYHPTFLASNFIVFS